MNERVKAKVSLVILNKNDAVSLKVIYPQIPFDCIDECFVIDGQSSDESAKVCAELGLRVIVQDKLGRGEAFRIARGETSGDYVVFLSSDGNENPADIPKFIELLENGNDMVIASRLINGGRNKDDGRFFPIRKWMLQLFTWAVNFAWKSNLTDVWNGYRAFRTNKLKTLTTTADNNLIELQQTIRAIKLNYRIAEFPTIEGQRISGKTQNPLLKTGLGLIGILLSELFKKHSQMKHSEYNNTIGVHDNSAELCPLDEPAYIGDKSTFYGLGWMSQISIEQTVSRVLNYWPTKS